MKKITLQLLLALISFSVTAQLEGTSEEIVLINTIKGDIPNPDDRNKSIINGTTGDDIISVSQAGNMVIVSMNGDEVLRQSTTNTLSLTINGGDGDDRVAINFSEENFTFPITFNGQGQDTSAGDYLAINGTFTNQIITHILPGADGNNGFLNLDGSQVAFTGLEPISAGNAANTIINLPNGVDNNATVQNSAIPGQTEIIDNGATFEDTIFPNPTASLTINGGNLNNSIIIQSLDAAYNADFNINSGDQIDIVTFQGATNISAGSYNINAQSLIINAPMLTFGGEVVLTASKNIVVNSLGFILAQNNNISLNVTSTNSLGNFGNTAAILIDSALLSTTGTGNISITAVPDVAATDGSNKGVSLINGAEIRNLDSGNITITGIGLKDFLNIEFINGVYIIDDSKVTVNNGDITILGTGGNGEDGNNEGVVIVGEIQATGNGAIAINGQGGLGAFLPNNNEGVVIGGALISSNGGGISIIGQAYDQGFSNSGIVIGGTRIEDLGSGAIGLTGIGSDGIGANYGLQLVNSTIASNGVGITVNGFGGGAINAGVNASTGVFVDNMSIIEDLANGTISIAGEGGNGGLGNQNGLRLSNSTIQTNSGNISVTGTVDNVVSEAINLNDFNSRILSGGTATITAVMGPLATPFSIPAASLIEGTTVTLNGEIQAGSSAPGQLPITGNTALSAGDELIITVDDVTTPGTDYDQLAVIGTIDISDATLTLVDNVVAPITIGAQLTIIDNDGADAIIGNFIGLAEGAVIPFNGQNLMLTYAGGDGNDVILEALPSPCQAATRLYVNTNATGLNNGTSWADAFTDLQPALDCADAGEEIWVAAGTYHPTEEPDGAPVTARNRAFHLANKNLKIYGGFAGTETLLTERDFTANPTILSGDFNNDDIVTGGGATLSFTNNGENAYHVFVSVGLTVGAELDGFSVQGGNANDFGSFNYAGEVIFNANAGGMYNQNSSPTVTNVTFLINKASNFSGGMHNSNSSPTITNVTFSRNNAIVGGGMLNELMASPIVTNVSFTANNATSGGGMYNLDASTSPTLTNVTFSANNATFDGGGMVNDINASPLLTNVTFSANSANNGGGGLANFNSSPTLTNILFYGNIAPNQKDILNNTSTPNVSFSAFEDYDITGCATCITLTASPFVDPANPNGVDGIPRTADDGLALIPGSPPVGAGTATGAPASDITGATRPSPPSMGAYETEVIDCTIFASNIAYVDTNATGANNGSSWADAFINPESAITAMNECPALDTIYVAEGTYNPTAPAGREATFSIPANAIVYGGFSPSNGAIDLATRDFRTYLSILDGDLGVLGDISDNAYQVSNTNGNATFDGLTIRNGNATGGGGFAGGGGINANNAVLTINNCTLHNNQGINGGAIRAAEGALITNSIFYNNNATATGGAIQYYMFGNLDLLRIENSLFYDNTSSGDGGAIQTDVFTSASLELINVTMTQNTAVGTGDAISYSSGGAGSFTSTITNSVIWDNDDDGTDDEINNSGMTDNGAFTYSLIKGIDLSGSFGLDGTNPASNPLFTNPVANDFTLQATSPAIDIGDDTAVTQALDLAGNTRIIDGNGDTIATVDFGAFESQVIAVSNILVNATTGDLEFTDNDDRDDDLTIVINATDFYRFTDPVNALIAGPGAIQIDPNTVDVLIASVTGTINIETLGGDDTFTTDFSFGNMTDIINYNGGNENSTNPGDILRLQGGGTFATVEHTFISESDGNVMITGNSAINYVGLEPIIDNLSVTDRIFSFTGPDETIILENEATPGSNIIDSSIGESVTFTNPTNSLTINTEVSGGSGLDFINIQGLDAAFDANLTVNAGADDDVSFTTNPTSIGSGSFDINAQTITASQNVTTTLTGSITFNASKNILTNSSANLSTDNGTITFNGNSASSATTGVFIGVDIDNAHISTTGTGAILMTGNGFSDSGGANFIHGVRMQAAATVQTLGSGFISLTGTGANGNLANDGVYIRDAGTILRSSGNGITLNGTAGINTGTFNVGVSLETGCLVEDVLNGDIDITGTGGIGTDNNLGVQVFGAGTQINANGGAISLNGLGGPGATGNSNSGISISGAAAVTNIGSGAISITGTANGPGISSNRGVIIGSSSVTTTTGTIIITGQGSLMATGGENRGSFINDSQVISSGGDININGTAGGTGAGGFQIGTTIFTSNQISTTGMGTISISGTGGISPFANTGVEIANTTQITAENGAITINGDTPDGSDGISLDGTVTTTGTGNVFLNGTTTNTPSKAINIPTDTGTIMAGGAITVNATTGKINTPAGIPTTTTFSSTTNTFNGILAPGQSPGLLQVASDVNLGTGDIFEVEIDNFTVPGTDYDQLVVTGTVDITDATLSLIDNTMGTGVVCTDELIIIDNDAADAITGTFAGLPEGTDIPFNGELWRISYLGGDGNDVSLSLNPGMIAAPICMDITVQLDATGTVSITAADVDGGTPMGCPFDNISIDITSFDCSNIGPNNVVLTVMDTFGNSADCTAIVTVEDVTPPTITCPADENVAFDSSCQFTLLDYTGLAIVADACDVAPVVMQNPVAGTVITATTTITLTATDASGNMDSCMFDVIPSDSTPPSISCPADQTEDLDANCEFILLDYTGLAIVLDNCDPNPTVTQSPIAGTVISAVTTVTIFAEDASGNINSCVFDVIPLDITAPTITCPADENVDFDANCEFILPDYTGLATVTDACDPAPVVSQSPAPGTAITATTIVTLTATDAALNSDSCMFSVIPADNTLPTAICQDITAQLDAAGMVVITASDIDNGSFDNCTGGVTYSIDITAFDCSHVGTNDVVLTVTDATGNSSSCTAIVTVEDNVAPMVICIDITVVLDGSGMVSIVPADIDGGATDACGIDTITIDIDTFDCSNVGPNDVILTVTDVNGNVSMCTAVVTVEDNDVPVAVCQDITVQLDVTGMATIVPADVDGGSTDNCGNIVGTLDIDTFDCTDVGTPVTVTLTVTDPGGNTSSCTAIVTVEDNVAPDAVCQDITISLDANGMATIVPADIDGGSTDACGISSLSIDVNTFDCDDVGPNNVTLSVSDVNGNVSSCVAVVTVEEENAVPMAVCQNLTVPLQQDGTATISPESVNAGSSGQGCINGLSLDIDTFDCSDVGTPVTVTLTVTNGNGDTSSCTAVITVIDSIGPEVTCPEDQLIEVIDTYILPDYFATGEATAEDNCTDPVTILDQDPSPGTPLGFGVHTIELTATDDFNHSTTCSFELTIGDILGVEDEEALLNTIVLYPNPANEFIMINNPQNVALKQLLVYDLTGRLVITENLEGMGTDRTVDVSFLQSATYMFIIQSDNGQFTKQIVKE